MIYIEELLFSPAIIFIYVCVFCFVYPYYDILNDKTKRRSICGYIVYQLCFDCKSAIVNLQLNCAVFLRRLRNKSAEFSFLCRRGLWFYKNAFSVCMVLRHLAIACWIFIYSMQIIFCFPHSSVRNISPVFIKSFSAAVFLLDNAWQKKKRQHCCLF